MTRRANKPKKKATALRIGAVADCPEKAERLRRALGKSVNADCVVLPQTIAQGAPIDDLVVWADLTAVDTILTVRALIRTYRDVERRLFVLDDRSHLASAQAYALGATHVLLAERSLDELSNLFPHSEDVVAAADSIDASVERSFRELETASIAVARGDEVNVEGLQSCADPMIGTLTRGGISSWIDVVRSHHEATYQHVLLVTGVLVDFGISLGMRHEDLRTLHLAAMLHDVGKAKIPLEILDKPRRLIDSERAVIELHPVIGFEALKDNPRISAEVLDAVRHHHEYLDGSGYPDRLSGSQISDIVRMTTIADIFSALIEERKYKAPMPRWQAYGILKQMSTRLEGALVTAFEKVALER